MIIYLKIRLFLFQIRFTLTEGVHITKQTYICTVNMGESDFSHTFTSFSVKKIVLFLSKCFVNTKQPQSLQQLLVQLLLAVIVGVCVLHQVLRSVLFTTILLCFTINRKCKNNPNKFCYIYGKVTMSDRRSNLTRFVRKSFHSYFGMELDDQDNKAFVPSHICCQTCDEGLIECLVPFGVPIMVWRRREGRDHTTDSYFWRTNPQDK